MTRVEAMKVLRRLRATSEAALKRCAYRREYHEARIAAITAALADMERMEGLDR